MQGLDQRVVAFVAAQCGVSSDRIRPQTTLLGDLGIDGDDGIELLEQFADEFAVDLARCNPTRHFGPEGLWPWAPIYWLILALRRGTPEQRARLSPISVADLIHAAEIGRWDGD
jgi:hypothetical protein